MLLGVDLGIRTGIALYDPHGKLLQYRSQNYGTMTRLRRGAHGVMQETQGLSWLVLEGGGAVASLWQREAEKNSIRVITIGAEQWRNDLFHPRARRTGVMAKESAIEAARLIIAWSGASRPTTLRHDAAEAILTGFWGVLRLGWLNAVPGSLQNSLKSPPFLRTNEKP
ncbi:MAG: hypothetical protein ACLFTB_05775 [Desulfovibrionales bacterium]